MSHTVEKSIGEIYVTDPVSEATLTYQIAYNNDSLSDAAELLYSIQSLKEHQKYYENIVAYCSQTLETTKLAVASDVKLDNNCIKSAMKSKDAKQLILEKQNSPSNESTEG